MKCLAILAVLVLSIPPYRVDAVETAPRISDREIVESLSGLKEGQRSLESRIDDLDIKLNGRMDDLNARLNKRIDDLDAKLSGRINDLDAKLNERIDDLDAKFTARISDLDAKFTARISDLDAKFTARISDLDAKLNGRIDDLRSEMNVRFVAVHARFDTLQWMFGLFITISLVILGFVLRMQWQTNRRLTRLETIQEKQGRDLEFLKSLIEKLLPPKGVL